MCEHKIEIKYENGYIVSYCRSCGQILDIKSVPTILSGTQAEVLADLLPVGTDTKYLRVGYPNDISQQTGVNPNYKVTAQAASLNQINPVNLSTE